MSCLEPLCHAKNGCGEPVIIPRRRYSGKRNQPGSTLIFQRPHHAYHRPWHKGRHGSHLLRGNGIGIGKRAGECGPPRTYGKKPGGFLRGLPRAYNNCTQRVFPLKPGHRRNSALTRRRNMGGSQQTQTRPSWPITEATCPHGL